MPLTGGGGFKEGKTRKALPPRQRRHSEHSGAETSNPRQQADRGDLGKKKQVYRGEVKLYEGGRAFKGKKGFFLAMKGTKIRRDQPRQKETQVNKGKSGGGTYSSDDGPGNTSKKKGGKGPIGQNTRLRQKLKGDRRQRSGSGNRRGEGPESNHGDGEGFGRKGQISHTPRIKGGRAEKTGISKQHLGNLVGEIGSRGGTLKRRGEKT